MRNKTEAIIYANGSIMIQDITHLLCDLEINDDLILRIPTEDELTKIKQAVSNTIGTLNKNAI